jgi:ornithine carbamoyltransferase
MNASIRRERPAPDVAWPSDLLRIADLNRRCLDELLELAVRMKAQPAAWTGVRAGETVACLFHPPTAGMTFCASAAAQRLGMLPVLLPREELIVGGGEPLGDITRTLSSSAAALLTHALAHRTLERIAAAASVPVINALSDQHRPCQALADLLTLRDRFGTLEGLAVAFVGNAADATAHSLMEAAALAGMEIRIASPPDYRPAHVVQLGAEVVAELHGGRIILTDDPREAVSGADAVYATAWVPPDRPFERETRLERLRRFQVHPGLMHSAKPEAIFMHSLPARRGEEVSEHVIDGRRSVVWEQAGNRVPATQAVLHALAGDAD